MAKFLANGVRHHVQRLPARQDSPGPAPVVVFVHGVFIDTLASFYFTLAPAFAAAGCEVITYDLRGHGKSERPPSGYRIDDFVTDLDALLDEMGVTAPVHLVGNSFGGTVAFGHAVRRPDRVASLTVIESGPATRAWTEIMAGALYKVTVEPDQAMAWFTTEFGRTVANLTPPQQAHLERLARAATRLMETTSIVLDIPTSTTVDDEALRAVRTPVLLLVGGGGLVSDETDRLQALLPRSRTVVMPGYKHAVLVEAPHQVGEATLAWIREQHAAATPAPEEVETG
ncbi:alpha/beta hydrolase [Longimycelium tulufanense]|uniref:Alpha/beta hydrolase n=1 Tax=Longimycelium tulufanense TaxID=907463 RepID=A0A8J3FUK0_9PSEU|nr:alpha/beta hydrolase [Longimycelium tulufanense]GGM51060.1 alpha/beta hydrolase [Longimycelium tulufanense]